MKNRTACIHIRCFSCCWVIFFPIFGNFLSTCNYFPLCLQLWEYHWRKVISFSWIPLPSVNQHWGYRGVTEVRLWPHPLKWGWNSNMYAWQYLVTDFVIMGWGRLEELQYFHLNPPAMTHTLWIMGGWNDHTAGQPFFSHCSGCEPLMVLTALAVSNVFLYTPQVIKRTILAIGLKKRFPTLLVSELKKGV